MVQENSLKNKIIVICGATCSGKSSLSLALAKALNTEIISADSMNIYKNLDIGTAKPTKQEQVEIKHHAVDIIEPFENFNVGDYREYALPIVKKLLQEGKTPIICGGTGFYINSLLYDLSYGNHPADLIVREKYFNLAEKYGNEYVYNILYKLDAKTANLLHYNDLKRVVRALEIAENGTKKSDICDKLTPIFNYDAYAINFDRETLYSRIDYRVDQMIKDGLVEEIKNLLSKGITKENQCMQGIGYKEIIPYIIGEYSLENAIDLIKLNTRHYAKRQITFFKKLENLQYLEPASVETMVKRIIEQLWLQQI